MDLQKLFICYSALVKYYNTILALDSINEILEVIKAKYKELNNLTKSLGIQSNFLSDIASDYIKQYTQLYKKENDIIDQVGGPDKRKANGLENMIKLSILYDDLQLLLELHSNSEQYFSQLKDSDNDPLYKNIKALNINMSNIANIYSSPVFNYYSAENKNNYNIGKELYIYRYRKELYERDGTNSENKNINEDIPIFLLNPYSVIYKIDNKTFLEYYNSLNSHLISLSFYNYLLLFLKI